MTTIDPALRSALAAIVEGREVKRSRHALILDGKPCAGAFVEVLTRHGYRPATVASVAVPPGRRVPAFLLDRDTAWFGWVFWEKFTDRKQRKLFGSVVRDARGDWAVQIPPGRPTVIYVNEGLALDMDADRPASL